MNDLNEEIQLKFKLKFLAFGRCILIPSRVSNVGLKFWNCQSLKLNSCKYKVSILHNLHILRDVLYGVEFEKLKVASLYYFYFQKYYENF